MSDKWIFLCVFERSIWEVWGSKEIHQARASGYSQPVGRYVGQFNPKVPSLVKQGPCKWSQLPQLPQRCPFSGKTSSHSILYQPNILFICHKPPNHQAYRPVYFSQTQTLSVPGTEASIYRRWLLEACSMLQLDYQVKTSYLPCWPPRSLSTPLINLWRCP